MSKSSQRKAREEWAEQKPKLDVARDPRGMYFIPDDELGYQEIM